MSLLPTPLLLLASILFVFLAKVILMLSHRFLVWLAKNEDKNKYHNIKILKSYTNLHTLPITCHW